jgi:hypothetical protein
MEVSDQFHAMADLTPDETTLGTHWIGGRVDTRTGLEVVEVTKIIPSP